MEPVEHRTELSEQSVAVTGDSELRYWTRQFGITPEQLRSIVAKVGADADAVRRYLQGWPFS
jgi:hypothetical protein